MSGGAKSLILNPAERIVSSDANRLQAFLTANAGELLRYLVDATVNELSSCGIANPGAATTNPLRAEIINGLLVRPISSATGLSIDPGVVAMVNPDVAPSADDSVLKIVTDPGLAAGSLFLTPNSSGTTRIDVLECQRTPDVVIETGSRDVFDPTTGLFTPLTVDKAKTDRLTYRFRIGTPGAGFPGTVSGWLPLVVVRVPNGTTTWNTCDVWDVRPLLVDSARQPFKYVSEFSRQPMGYAVAESPDNVARNLSGFVELEYQGRRVGGQFNAAPNTTPIDLRHSNASIIEPGFSAVPGPWFVWLAFPFGLPRWCKYVPASAGTRFPGGLRGMPIYSQTPSLVADGTEPDTPLTLPSGLGFGAATTTDAVIAVAGAYATLGTTWLGATVVGRWTHLSGAVFDGIDLPITGVPGTTTNFDFDCRGIFPSRATALRIKFRAVVSIAADLGLGTHGAAPVQYSRTIKVFGSTGGGQNVTWNYTDAPFATQFATIAAHNSIIFAEIPLVQFPGYDQSATRRIQFSHSTVGLPASSTITLVEAHVLGWEMGH